MEVLLIAKRHCGIDTHAALETGVGSGPLLVAGGHALGRHEGLATPTRNRVEDVGLGVDAGGEAPHHIVHGIDVGVFADRDRQAHALRASEDGTKEVALPAFLDLVALFHLDDAATPVGHGIGNMHILNDARLQAIAKLKNCGFANGGVDVELVHGVHGEREVDRARLGLAHGDGGDMEGRRLVGLAHVAGPLRMEEGLALHAQLFRFLGLVALVARTDHALEHIFGVGHGVGVDRLGLHQTDG